MTTKTIKCLSCDGTGRETMRLRVGRSVLIGHSGFPCPHCNGSGYERPPTDHDKRAQQAIESRERSNENQ